ncbi:MAG: hypothetical protein E6I30_04910 [Chloroflexi bacterium]|nr:MAG: hypothetical protein E6I30_04910 [Chloroflexota bacterium]
MIVVVVAPLLRRIAHATPGLSWTFALKCGGRRIPKLLLRWLIRTVPRELSWFTVGVGPVYSRCARYRSAPTPVLPDSVTVDAPASISRVASVRSPAGDAASRVWVADGFGPTVT